MSAILTKISQPKILLLLLILALPLIVWVFPWRRSQLVSLTGLTNPTFDVRFAYSSQDLLQALPSYGSEARYLYAISEVTLDFIFPLLYTAFLIGIMAWLYRSAFPANSALHKLIYLPFGVLLADLLENISLTGLLLAYPPALIPLVRAASVFSLTKWLLSALVMLFIFAGLLSFLFTWMQEKTRNRN